MSYNDTRDPSLTHTLHDFQGYISAPANTDGSTCAYIFPGMDAVVGDGAWGCDGILSTDCRDWLMDEINSGTSISIENFECPKLPDSRDIVDRCGDAFEGGIISTSTCNLGVQIVSMVNIKTGQPLNLTNTTCTISSPPGSSMPLGYLTYPILGFNTAPSISDEEHDNFTFYDQYTRQVRPWLLATQYEYERGLALSTRMLCVAPDELVEGGRRPEGEWPPEESGAACIDKNSSSILAAALGALSVLALSW